ncbi:alpha/beta-hydrolase [Penicillium lagena]|uniref:alpha/beta-hydrolase n=1 Tax=Penicillium lagena TaxID=94218 RepID=UPI00253FBDF9|nr:alpha/beta-hydrolase [Penicillium lagena]KAJ5604893.1 alpha/beta-hydrolase [Penicillium lagena]
MKPVLIFVHGGWHTPECWTYIVSLLRPQGYECVTPQLDYSGTAKPVESIASSIEQIQKLLNVATMAGRDVVLVNHSFGGVVGCSAVKGFTQKNSSQLHAGSGRVIGIIHLSAIMVPSHCSVDDLASLSPDPLFHNPGPDGWQIIDNGDPRDVFYNDLPLAEGDYWAGKLRKQSSAAFADRDNIYQGWADIPVWYLYCTDDHALPVKVQEEIVSAAIKLGAEITTEYIASGHSPFLSKAADTVRFICDAINALQRSETELGS